MNPSLSNKANIYRRSVIRMVYATHCITQPGMAQKRCHYWCGHLEPRKEERVQLVIRELNNIEVKGESKEKENLKALWGWFELVMYLFSVLIVEIIFEFLYTIKKSYKKNAAWGQGWWYLWLRVLAWDKLWMLEEKNTKRWVNWVHINEGMGGDTTRHW